MELDGVPKRRAKEWTASNLDEKRLPPREHPYLLLQRYSCLLMRNSIRPGNPGLTVCRPVSKSWEGLTPAVHSVPSPARPCVHEEPEYSRSQIDQWSVPVWRAEEAGLRMTMHAGTSIDPASASLAPRPVAAPTSASSFRGIIRRTNYIFIAVAIEGGRIWHPAVHHPALRLVLGPNEILNLAARYLSIIRPTIKRSEVHTPLKEHVPVPT